MRSPIPGPAPRPVALLRSHPPPPARPPARPPAQPRRRGNLYNFSTAKLEAAGWEAKQTVRKCICWRSGLGKNVQQRVSKRQSGKRASISKKGATAALAGHFQGYDRSLAPLPRPPSPNPRSLCHRSRPPASREGRHNLPPTPAATALTPPRRRPHSSGVTQLLRRTRMKRNNVVKAGSKTATRLSVLGRIKLEPGYKAPPVFDEVLPHGQVFSCTALYRSLFMGEVKVGALYDWDGHCTLTRAREYRMRP